MVMIFAGGHVSGGHYNPAVTLGVWMRGRCPTSDVVPYWVSQVVAALVAVVAVRFLVGAPTGAAMVPNLAPAFVAEFLFTFALVYVVINVATAKGTSIWVHIGAELLGGAVAAMVFKAINPEDK